MNRPLISVIVPCPSLSHLLSRILVKQPRMESTRTRASGSAIFIGFFLFTSPRSTIRPYLCVERAKYRYFTFGLHRLLFLLIIHLNLLSLVSLTPSTLYLPHHSHFPILISVTSMYCTNAGYMSISLKGREGNESPCPFRFELKGMERAYGVCPVGYVGRARMMGRRRDGTGRDVNLRNCGALYRHLRSTAPCSGQGWRQLAGVKERACLDVTDGCVWLQVKPLKRSRSQVVCCMCMC
jgi:hypothetical protein